MIAFVVIILFIFFIAFVANSNTNDTSATNTPDLKYTDESTTKRCYDLSCMEIWTENGF